MSSRELVVLGTASQVPTSARNHNGYMLLWDDRGFLFDPGEGTQRQMTRAGVSAHLASCRLKPSAPTPCAVTGPSPAAPEVPGPNGPMGGSYRRRSTR